MNIELKLFNLSSVMSIPQTVIKVAYNRLMIVMIKDDTHRVILQVEPNLSLTSKQKFCFGQDRPKQN